MTRSAFLAMSLLLLGGLAAAASLGTEARESIPQQAQQIISVDYRELANSPEATELHDRVLPPDLKSFEAALRGVGIEPQRDIDHLTFASFRDGKQLRFVGVADGRFALKSVIARLRAKKVKPVNYQGALLYPMTGGFEMTLLDDSTLLFGAAEALQAALDARNGSSASLSGNSELTDIMPDVDGSPVWSVLDAQGTQEMLRSALGSVAKLADFETVKDRILASRYQLSFNQGMNFDLDVVTSDSFTATSLASLVRAAMIFEKMQAAKPEKPLFDEMTVDSDSDLLRVHFKADEQQFQSLLNSPLFAAVSR